MNHEKIPFNKPYKTGFEVDYILNCLYGDHFSGDGIYTKKCHEWLEQNTDCAKALLTHSCTAALEMTALLLHIHPDDEIIMPSYTFVSTANAFVLQGAIPVFVDICPNTLNIDEQLIEQAITAQTRAIVVVHYAGVACEMDKIMDLATRYNLIVIEDAAQSIMASYKGKKLGGIGHLGAYSFHETKNIIAGEGGALLVNDPQFSLKAEIIREKGTDRSQFLRGEVDKYTWQTVGSSFLPGEMVAAFLLAQLEKADLITEQRLASWNYYHEILQGMEFSGLVRRPIIPAHCQHNAHMYYLILAPEINREQVLEKLKNHGVYATSHYVPLHSSQAGLKFGKIAATLPFTESLASRIIRLPLWVGITQYQQDRVIKQLSNVLH
jgi:dTDP-4-amino-4,6-dideoxygalactose transaminase